MTREVLVIEDNEQNVYLMQYLLQARGLHAVVANEGQEGIKLAKKRVPDLILLDIQLPTINGYDVARILREDRTLAGVPIIAVTSYAMPGDREKALASGCTGYIEKPINPDSFVDELEAYLSRRANEAQGRDS